MDLTVVELLPWTSALDAPLGLPEAARNRWPRSPRRSLGDGAGHDELCEGLAVGLMERQPSTQLKECFPWLPAALPLTALVLGSRASTMIERWADGPTLGVLLRATVADLSDIPGAGPLTVREVCAALVRAALTEGPGVWLESAPEPVEPMDPVLVQLLGDLEVLARWRRVRGAQALPLMHVSVEDGSPEQVHELAARISALTAADLPPDPTKPDAVAELEGRFGAMHERERLVLRRRFFAEAPLTLADLGAELGVTRERVRQIEVQAKAALAGRFGLGTAVGNLLASMRIEINPVAALDRLLARHPELGREVPSMAVPLWLALDRLDDAFIVSDGWAVAPGIDEAGEQTRTWLAEFESAHGVVELAALRAVSSLPGDELLDWLRWCGYPLFRERAFTRSGSVGDHSAAILEVVGEPLGAEELIAHMDKDRSPRSLANALGTDDRFVRADRARWALAEWGVEEYTTIRSQIASALDENGGEIPLGELITRITGRFDVAESSVLSFASGGDFEVCAGQVRRRSGPSTARKTPEQTRRLYRHGDMWRLRVTINSDHLRGSGFAVPAAVAGLAGCRSGQTVEYASRLGPQAIRWTGSQPGSGTIRRFLDEFGSAVGDEVFLEFHADRSFDVLRVIVPAADAEPLHRVLAAVGRPDAVGLADAEIVAALAESVGLSGEDRPRRVLSAFRGRGEDDLIPLLEQAWVGGS